jgi:hypothetical protein
MARSHSSNILVPGALRALLPGTLDPAGDAALVPQPEKPSREIPDGSYGVPEAEFRRMLGEF